MPHLLFDVVHYLGGIVELKTHDNDLDFKDSYANMVEKQMKRTAIMNDVTILTKRKERGWVHDYDEIQKKINSLDEGRCTSIRIDISNFLAARKRSPRFFYSIK
jgi:hypothetical protein